MPVSKGPEGVAQEMRKFKQGKLHSGSKTGPIVKDRKQAIAIALNEAGMSKKAGMGKGAAKGCPMCKGGKGKCTCGKGGYAMGGSVKKGGSSCRGVGKATKGGKFSGVY